MKKYLSLFLAFVQLLSASPWTNWTEDPSDPIYNPFPFPINFDYFPYVIFNENTFDGNGVPALYKMWHQGTGNTIATSYSNDGVNWTLLGVTNIPPFATRPVVLYDKNGFGVGGKPYRMWFRDPNGAFLNAIRFTQSNDGLIWDPSVTITQDPGAPITNTSGYFHNLEGPAFIIYNPSATSTPGEPYTFPYVMFFDTSPLASNTIVIGLAYSSDGLLWTRYGSDPMLIPSGNPADWDGLDIWHPSVFVTEGTYHMFYSGSNGLGPTLYGDGIGHASSTDGVNWVKDVDNPIFIYTDGVTWRNGRTYTPFALFHPFCDLGSCPTCFAKMWFTGGMGSVQGTTQGIGYATLPCPPLPAPLPPSNFEGIVQTNQFLNKTECILKATWTASSSPDVVLYRIYLNGVVVAEIPATDPLVFVTCLRNCKDRPLYEVVAVNSNNVESTPVEIVYV